MDNHNQQATYLGGKLAGSSPKTLSLDILNGEDALAAALNDLEKTAQTLQQRLERALVPGRWGEPAAASSSTDSVSSRSPIGQTFANATARVTSCRDQIEALMDALQF